MKMSSYVQQPQKEPVLPLMLIFASLEVVTPFALCASQLKWVYLSTPAIDTLVNNPAVQCSTTSPQGRDNAEYFCKSTSTILGKQSTKYKAGKFYILCRVKAKVPCQPQQRSETEINTKSNLGMTHFFIILHRQVHTAVQIEPLQCDVVA